MTRHVAFFRNMNLGHAGSPVRDQLEHAFEGAEQVRSFQTNGTVLFAADDPMGVVERALDDLRGSCGYEGRAFTRSLDVVAPVAESDVWEAAGDDVFGLTLTFFDADPAALPPLPWSNDSGDVTILQVRKGCALGVSRQLRASPGDPNSTLERLLDAQATTRSRGTVQRLLRAATPPSA